MTRDEIIKIGAAPNPQQNATLPQARAMAKHFEGFALTAGIVVNTRSDWPVEASLVPVESIVPPLDDTTELMLLLQVNAGSRVVPLSVATWHGTVSRWGPRQATKVFLDALNPRWGEDATLLSKLVELSDVPPSMPVDIGPPVAAMPDWDAPLAKGTLGVRAGDGSKLGTEYTSPSGVKWVKSVSEETMFGYAWKRVN